MVPGMPDSADAGSITPQACEILPEKLKLEPFTLVIFGGSGDLICDNVCGGLGVDNGPLLLPLVQGSEGSAGQILLGSEYTPAREWTSRDSGRVRTEKIWCGGDPGTLLWC